MLRKQKGFTLIELLIVIVIIGILAGVLIAVIDPVSQQNRAADAGIQASINKVVLVTEGYISSYGTAPDEVQFFGQFKNQIVEDPGAQCELAGGTECLFTVTGNDLSSTCLNANWYGEGSDACYYRYEATSIANGQFKVFAKSTGLTEMVFKYENFGSQAGEIQQCPAATPDC